MSLLATLLGENNPVTQWTGRNSNLLTGLGTSLLSDGMNFQPAQVGATLDRQAAAQKDADAKLAATTNATKTWLAQKYPDLAQAVDAGLPVSDAWQEAFKRQQPGYGQSEPIKGMEINGKLVNPFTGELIGDFSNPAAGPTAPAGYRVAQDGTNLEFIPGGPADPARKKATGPMDATTKRELFEADDAAKAGEYVLSALDEAISLNDKAYDGPFADVRGDTTALVGDESGVATARMKNVTTELALSQLKTIFGSMPTEGERKILLELQGSVNQARPVRAGILKRARQLAERRIADAQAKAQGLRSGGYFDESYGQPAAGGGADPDVDSILQQYGVP